MRRQLPESESILSFFLFFFCLFRKHLPAVVSKARILGGSLISAPKHQSSPGAATGHRQSWGKDVNRLYIPLFPPNRPLNVEGQSLVDLVLEDVQVVCGCDGDNVLLGVPRGVEDLLAEVQAIDADLILTTLPAYAHLEDDGGDGHPDEIKRVKYVAHQA